MLLGLLLRGASRMRACVLHTAVGHLCTYLIVLFFYGTAAWLACNYLRNSSESKLAKKGSSIDSLDLWPCECDFTYPAVDHVDDAAVHDDNFNAS